MVAPCRIQCFCSKRLISPCAFSISSPLSQLPLDFSPERWTCAIHCLDAVFYPALRKMSVSFEQSAKAIAILDELAQLVESGYECRALQRSPHLVLLNIDWYHENMLRLMAEWMMLWLAANHFTGLSHVQTVAYLTDDDSKLEGVVWEEGVEARARQLAGTEPLVTNRHRLVAMMEHSVDERSFKLLNLCHEWLRTYLPHCLAKIDRVSFGLLSADEYKRLLEAEPLMPRSRFKLAIPFVGKDVPSRASEFAHPDVIIGLTILAYRYEGLRVVDFEQDVIALLRADFDKEVGPFHQRKSARLYRTWVEQANGAVLGMSTYTVSEEKTMVPLWLLRSSNSEQMSKLFRLIGSMPAPILHYLTHVIFPCFMTYQALKLSASGQELGGSIMFKNRIGFSGTPSDLLPLDLGRCGYEPGSDGKVLQVLTDTNVVSVVRAPEDWTVTSLLSMIANAEPAYNALIDVGAVITGLSNLAVARRLLELGLRRCEGVVFLDEEDSKMILVRATDRVVPLSQCGINVDSRFAFYDQIHTTGMDIKHALNAKAALTLGKDMVFRDLAQGAFRMRGIGAGQTVEFLLTPEVSQLMARQLGRCRTKGQLDSLGQPIPSLEQGQLLKQVSAWLIINAMRSEAVQCNMLYQQSLTNIWRERAFEHLVAEHQVFAKQADGKGVINRLLGDTFISSASIVSSEQLCRVVCVLFASASQFEDESGCMASIKHTNLLGSKTASVLWVPLGSRVTSSRQNALLKVHVGCLAIPAAHTVRIRRLVDYFEAPPAGARNKMVIVERSSSGHYTAITLCGEEHFGLARQLHECNLAMTKLTREERQRDVTINTQKAQVATATMNLKPFKDRLRRAARPLDWLDERDVNALARYVSEPHVAQDVADALKQAETAVSEARRNLQLLEPSHLADVAETTAPTPELVAAVDAVCIVLGRTQCVGDFTTAQIRLMRPTAASLTRRMVQHDPRQLSASLASRLHSFAIAASPPAEQVVACAMRGWVLSILSHQRCVDAVTLATEASKPSASLSAVAAVICEVAGDGLRCNEYAAHFGIKDLLQFADRFPDDVTEQTGEQLEALEDRIWKLDGMRKRVAGNTCDLMHQQTSLTAASDQAIAKIEAEVTVHGGKIVHAVLRPSAGGLEKQAARIMRVLLYMVSPATMKGEKKELITALSEAFPFPRTEDGAGDGARVLVKQLRECADKVRKSELDADHEKTIANLCGMLQSNELRIEAGDTKRKLPSAAANPEAYGCKAIAGKQLASWIHAVLKHYMATNELKAANVLLAKIDEERKVKVDELNSLLRSERASGVSAMTVSNVCRSAHQQGAKYATRQMAVHALKNCAGFESAALSMVLKLPQARSSLACMRNPALLQDFGAKQLSAESGTQILLHVHCAGAHAVLTALQAEDVAQKKQRVLLGTASESSGEDEDMGATSGAAGEVVAVQPGEVVTAQAITAQATTTHAVTVAVPIAADSSASAPSSTLSGEGRSSRRATRGSSAEGSQFRSAATWLGPMPGYVFKAGKLGLGYYADAGLQDISAMPTPAARAMPVGSVAGPLKRKHDDTALLQLREAHNSECLLGELHVLRWAMALADLTAQVQIIKPLQESLDMTERQREANRRKVESTTETKREAILSEARSLRVSLEHMPASAPYRGFPWRDSKPITTCELALNRAVGLRDEKMLASEIKTAQKLLLTKASSVPYFRAVTMSLQMEHQRAKCGAEKRRPSLGTAARLPLAKMESVPSRSKAKPALSADEALLTHTPKSIETSLNVFLEQVDSSVCEGVPKQRLYHDVLSDLAAEHIGLMHPGRDFEARDAILASAAASAITGAGAAAMETEQCREQEQEQEQEAETEQEMEMERYVDQAYGRECEEQVPWSVHTLADAAAPFKEGSISPLSQFALHGRTSLAFPEYLSVSRNHYNKDWLGDRRCKNAIIVMEWCPSMSGLLPLQSARALTQVQSERMHKALQLFDVRGDGRFDAESLQVILSSFGDTMSKSDIKALFLARGSETLSTEQVLELVADGSYRQEESGRHFVLLSLAEAETLRCLIHLRQGKSLIDGSDAAIALRCVTAGDVVLDVSRSTLNTPVNQAAASHAAFRFFDCTMHFREADIAILLRVLTASKADRMCFFASMMACRRRLAKRWEETPLVALFSLFEDEWSIVVQRAVIHRLRGAVADRGLLAHDAFVLFDGRS